MPHFGSAAKPGDFSPRARADDAETLLDAPNPVAAKRPARVPPSADLLTAKDLAKAFQLGYDPYVQSVPIAEDKWAARYRAVALRIWDRGFWIGAATALMVAVIGLGVWAMGRSQPPREARLSPETREAREAREIHAPSFPAAQATAAGAEKLPSEAQLAASVTEASHPIRLAAPVPKPAPASIQSASKTSPVDDARMLWLAALEAESHRDFTAAIQKYERIESLPDSQWPTGLKTRLQLARQELAGGIR